MDTGMPNSKQTHYLKIYNDRIEEQNRVTIKQCHTVKQAFHMAPRVDLDETATSNSDIMDINS